MSRLNRIVAVMLGVTLSFATVALNTGSASAEVPERSSEGILIPDPSVLELPAVDMADQEASPEAWGWTCYAPVGARVTCSSGASYWGYPGFKQQYNWSSRGPSHAFVMARGWNGNREIWTSAGAGLYGSTRVSWGNVASDKKVRVQSLNPPAGVTVDWW